MGLPDHFNGYQWLDETVSRPWIIRKDGVNRNAGHEWLLYDDSHDQPKVEVLQGRRVSPYYHVQSRPASLSFVLL